jgi:hypothetical protein
MGIGAQEDCCRLCRLFQRKKHASSGTFNRIYQFVMILGGRQEHREADTNARAYRKISLKNRKIIGRLGLLGFQPEMCGAALASLNEQFPFDQIEEISVRGVVRHIERLATPTAGDCAFPLNLNHDPLLPLVELSFNRRRDESPSIVREFQSLVILVRALEGDDEKAVLLGVQRGVQPVVEHRVTHPGETAAALLHEVHRREGLGNHGIARARTIVAATEFCPRQGRWRITWAGHNNAVGIDLNGDFAAGFLVIAMCDVRRR